jgi:hypothetical protein
LFYGNYNCWYYVFEGKEDEICEKIRGLKQKKTVPTPESVLIKMVSSRLINLQNLIDETNKSIKERIEWINTLPEENRHKNEVVNFVDDLEFKDIENNFVRFKQVYSSWKFMRLVDGFQQVLKKPTMTLEIVKKAWDIFITHGVMKS